MALGGRDVLKLVVDADSAGAVKEFDKLGREIKKTVGSAEKGATGLKGKFGNAFQGLADRSTLASSALGKLGISGQQAGMAIASAIPAAGVAAAGALALFAAKGVQAFQTTALAADKFADSTGLGVEEASKWIAVADDVGVSAGTFQSAFVKMEKAIETNRSAFGDLIATAQDGSTDLSATFLNVITHLQGIEDPIKRASEASKFFGRGFAEVSEIITTDAEDLKASLEDVSEAQIITPQEVAKAREFEAAMDSLGDAVRDVSIVVGEALVPALSDLAAFGAKGIEIAINFKTNFDEVDEQTGGVLGEIGAAAYRALNPVESLKNAVNILGDAFGKDAESAAAAATATDRLAGSKDRGFAASQRAASAAAAEISVSAGMVAAKDRERAANAGVTAELERQNDALAANNNAMLASFDSTFAVTDAQNRFTTAAFAANTAVDDGSTVLNEQTIAQDEAARAALGAAGAAVRQAQDQATLEGSTLSAKDATKIQIDTLTGLATKIGGPVAEQIMGMVGRLKTLDQTNADPDATLNDQASGPVGLVGEKVNLLDGQSATVTVNANTGNASAALQRVYERLQNLKFEVGKFGLAGGVQNWRGGVTLVGEEGPELVNLPKGSDVYTAGETAQMLSTSAAPALPTGGGGGGATVVNFNGTFLTSKAELGRMVDEALAESRRRGNRAA